MAARGQLHQTVTFPAKKRTLHYEQNTRWVRSRGRQGPIKRARRYAGKRGVVYRCARPKTASPKNIMTLNDLSPRRRQVAELVELPEMEIGRRLGIAERTVRQHVWEIARRIPGDRLPPLVRVRLWMRGLARAA